MVKRPAAEPAERVARRRRGRVPGYAVVGYLDGCDRQLHDTFMAVKTLSY